MTFTAGRTALQEALALCCRIAGKTKVLQILNNIRVTVRQGKATFVAVSTDISVRRTISVESSGDCDFLIDAQSLAGYVKTLRSESVVFDVDIPTCKVSHPSGHITLAVSAPTQWPHSDFDDRSESVDIPFSPQFLARAVDHSQSFIDSSSSPQSPVMGTMCLRFRDGVLSYNATDTRKLIRDSRPAEGAPDIDILVARETLPLLAQALAAAASCTLCVRDTSVVFSCDSTDIAQTRLVYRFPDATRVIPKDHSVDVDIDCRQLMSAIRRISSSIPGTVCVVADFTFGQCTLTATDIEGGKEVKETLDCECNMPITVGLSAGHALDCLSVVDDDNVTLQMTAPDRPVVFFSATAPDRKVLLMTMRVRSDNA